MLAVHVHVWVRPDRLEEFLSATLGHARAALREPGMLRFDIAQEQGDPAHVVLVEVFRDVAATLVYKESEHYPAWCEAVAGMMARPRQPTRFIPLRVEGM